MINLENQRWGEIAMTRNDKWRLWVKWGLWGFGNGKWSNKSNIWEWGYVDFIGEEIYSFNKCLLSSISLHEKRWYTTSILSKVKDHVLLKYPFIETLKLGPAWDVNNLRKLASWPAFICLCFFLECHVLEFFSWIILETQFHLHSSTLHVLTLNGPQKQC